MATQYIIMHNDGICCGPYSALADAQSAAAAKQAAAVATDPAKLRGEVTTDGLTYYVVEHVQATKNVQGVLFTTTTDRAYDAYCIKGLGM